LRAVKAPRSRPGSGDAGDDATSSSGCGSRAILPRTPRGGEADAKSFFFTRAMNDAEAIAGIAPPRYDGASLLNLAATLSASLGVPPSYPLLADAPLREAMLGARHLVLWLIDGLGVEPLQALAPRSALAAAMRGEVEAIFPSSTAPTLTMLATGRSPAANAAPEWFLWLDELGAVYRSLPLDAREPGAGRPPIRDATAIYPQPSLAARSGRRCFAVLPQSIADTVYSRYAHAGAGRLAYRDAAGFVDAVAWALAAGGDGSHVFAYVDAFDAAAHEFGVDSREARAVVSGLDRIFEKLSAVAASCGALLVVTADHGFLDVPPERRFHLEAFAGVAECLDRPLCGGPRAPFAYVKPGWVADFAAVVDSALGDHFVAIASAALTRGGWFGPEAPDPRLLARIGTHVLLPKSDAYLLQFLPGERVMPLIGMHGGRLAAETRVPLIVAGAGAP
jgi:hypothetical protein